ncbi:MAG: hypothetical protein A4E57_04434 [Syntrophorhabdaceae bacterium PtaU1.Bin034]|nr:MAG: hypothetical protein A4E57_04434 [Syntrophorhabdaceae bacterium PtaU1.Bin034]
MNAAVPEKACISKRGHKPENPLLLWIGELGLKTDHIVHASFFVFPPELYDRICVATGSRVPKPYRLHGTEGEGVLPALRHHFYGKTAFKVGRLFKFPQIYPFRADKGFVKQLVFLPAEGAIKVIIRFFAVTVTEKSVLHVDGAEVDDGGNGIEEMQVVCSRYILDESRERRRGERSGSNDYSTLFRYFPHLFSHDPDPGMTSDRPGDALSKPVSVNNKGFAARYG